MLFHTQSLANRNQLMLAKYWSCEDYFTAPF